MQRIERETIITLNDAEDKAEVYSCQSQIWTRMRKLGIKPQQVQRGENGRIQSMTFQVPVKYILIRKPRKVTEKQREWGRALAVSMRQPQAGQGPK